MCKCISECWVHKIAYIHVSKSLMFGTTTLNGDLWWLLFRVVLVRLDSSSDFAGACHIDAGHNYVRLYALGVEKFAGCIQSSLLRALKKWRIPFKKHMIMLTNN